MFTETKYDNLDRVEKTSNPYRSGETIYWSKPRYDELNRVVETYAPAIEGQTGASLGITEFGISTVQDFIGTCTTATDASGRRARSITNALGQLVRIDEPTGNNELGSLGEPNQPTFYKYNPQGKMVHVIQGKAGEPAIQHRYFLYDYLGRLIRVKQPEQEVNTALDLTDTVTNNNQWTAGFEYDLVGNLKKTTDAKGSVITNSYDKAGRVTERTYNDPNTPSLNYYYDGTGLGAVPQYSKGKLTKVSSTISASLFTSFDNFGRVLTHQQITDNQTYDTAYKYNLDGALVEETYPSGKVVRNFFKSDGDLSKVVRNGKVYVSELNYSASGRVNSLKLGNGRWETSKFNSSQQLTELALGANQNDTNLFKLQYDYGELASNGTLQNSGNITKQTITLPNASFVQTYKYDALDRLTEAKEINGNSTTVNWKQTFGYDRFGNRVGFTQEINNQNLLINSQTLPTVDINTNRFNLNQGFQYDKTGNVIQDIDRVTGLQRSFTFNAENKQVHVKDANNAPVGTYYYDGNGNRVKKSTSTETTVFVYDAVGKMVAEYSTKLSQNPTISYLTADHLGTPRVITDKNGNIISRRDFMPFGEDLYAGVGSRTGDTGQKYSSSLDEIRQKFTGYQKDKETNLDFAEARYYNNQFGRFTAVDPLLASGKVANPQTYNRYVYALNNPLRFVDRDGQIPIDTVVDLLSLSASYYDFIKQPGFTAAAYVAWDITATLVPYLPGSWITKSVTWAQKASQAARRTGIAFKNMERLEFLAKIGRDGYKGFKVQKLAVADDLERAVNNTLVKRYTALLGSGDTAVREVLGKKTGAIVDFLGIRKGMPGQKATYVLAEAKGKDIDKAVYQLRETAKFLTEHTNYAGESIDLKIFLREGTELPQGYELVGKSLYKWDDGALVAVEFVQESQVLNKKGILETHRRVSTVEVEWVKPEFLNPVQ